MAKKVDTAAMMDRGAKRLRQLHDVIGWLLDHWEHLPAELYKFERGQWIPVNVREYLTDLARQDLANVVAPAINWREFKAANEMLSDSKPETTTKQETGEATK